MKIVITEQDVRSMVKKAVQSLQEMAPMRDVRKIIISNILNKHWAFKGDTTVAWAYYVMNHQGNREGAEMQLSNELLMKLKNALSEESRLVAEQEARQAKAYADAEEWLKNNPWSLEEIGWNPQGQYSEDQLFEMIDKVMALYKEKGVGVGSYDSIRTGKKVDVRTYDSERSKSTWDTIGDIKKRIAKMQEQASKFEYLDAGYLNGHEDREKAGDPTMVEINKRFLLIQNDPRALTFTTYYSNRGYESYYNPKYNMSWSVDSSD